MRNIIILSLALVIWAGVCGAQGWERIYGELGQNEATSVIEALDGGYVVAGFYSQRDWVIDTIIFGTDTLFDSTEVTIINESLIKINDTGDTAWIRSIASRDTDISPFEPRPFLSYAHGGGYVLSGGGDHDCWLAKLGIAGDIVWLSNLPFSHGHYSMSPTSDEEYVLTGVNPHLVKTDSLGDTLLTRHYDDIHILRCIVEASYGGYVLGGRTLSLHGLMFKVDTSGTLLWATFVENSTFFDLKRTSDSGYILAGYTTSYTIMLVRTDSVGDTLWVRTYGGEGSGMGRSVIETSDGGFVATGYTTTHGAGGRDVYLLKVDGDGNELWFRTFGDVGYEDGLCVIQTPDGGYLIAGWKQLDSWEETRIYLVKTDSLGYSEIKDTEYGKPHALSLTAFPNPFNSSCAITAPAGAEVEIYDLRGTLRLRSVPDDNRSLSGGCRAESRQAETTDTRAFIWTPAQTIASGIYLVRARTDDGNCVTKRIVYIR